MKNNLIRVFFSLFMVSGIIIWLVISNQRELAVSQDNQSGIQQNISEPVDIKPRVGNNGVKYFEVGVLYWSMNIPGQVAMRKGLEKAATEINKKADNETAYSMNLLPYVAGDGTAGMEKQIKQFKELVNKKVDLIIVQPTDIAALSESLQMANQAKIPVVAYDQHILGGDLHSFLTSDNYQAGFLDGEYVGANFDDEQIIKVILIEYPHVSSTVARVNGFIDEIGRAHV